MLRNAELIVEQFENGISTKWRDVEGILQPTCKVALNNELEKAIGEDVWSDIDHIFREHPEAEKIRIRLSYEII